MKRREFVEHVGAASAALVAGGVIAGGMQGHVAQAQEGEHHHENVTGPLANATVSFGAWPTPLDRTAPVMGPPPNVHRLIPGVTTIKVGGTVNFIVAGLHQIVVYGAGKTPEDVNATLLQPMPPPPVPGPPLPPVINDPDRRIFRGAFPSLFFPNVDRVEVVQFSQPGVHLVICAIAPHFADDMYGWVRVLR
jgi:plastocyanin